MPYRCAKFERNRSMGRVFSWLKVTFVKRCEEKKKKVKEIGQFSGTHISRTTRSISFKFGM